LLLVVVLCADELAAGAAALSFAVLAAGADSALDLAGADFSSALDFEAGLVF